MLAGRRHRHRGPAPDGRLGGPRHRRPPDRAPRPGQTITIRSRAGWPPRASSRGAGVTTGRPYTTSSTRATARRSGRVAHRERRRGDLRGRQHRLDRRDRARRAAPRLAGRAGAAGAAGGASTGRSRVRRGLAAREDLLVSDARQRRGRADPADRHARDRDRRGRPAQQPAWPRFVVDGVHRTTSLLAVVFLVVHIVTAVLDSFAPISLLDAVIPFVGAYRPLWLGLGAAAFDLLLAVVITSLAPRAPRSRELARRALARLRAPGRSRYCTASAPAATSPGWMTGDLRRLHPRGARSIVVRAHDRLARAHARARLGALGGARRVCARAGRCGSPAARWAATGRGAPAPPRPLLGRRLGTRRGSVSLPRAAAGRRGRPMILRRHRRVHGELTRPPAGDGRRRGAGRASSARGCAAAAAAAFRWPPSSRPCDEDDGRRSSSSTATEGEPMSVKDRTAAGGAPHLVIDGALCCRRAPSAPTTIVFALDDQSSTSDAVALAALPSDRSCAGELPRRRSSRAGGLRHRPGDRGGATCQRRGTALPDAQRAAGHRARRRPPSDPGVQCRDARPRRADRPPRRRWFRELGSDDEPGSALVTLSGAVGCPGVYEIEHGSLLAIAARRRRGLSEPLRAFLFGGYAGGWIDAAVAARARLSRGRAASAAAPSGRRDHRRAAPQRLPGRRGQPRRGLDGRPERRSMRALRQRPGGDRRHAGRICDGRRRRATPRPTCAAGASWSPAAERARIPTERPASSPAPCRCSRAEFEDHARHGPCDACDAPPVLTTPGPRAPVA